MKDEFGFDKNAKPSDFRVGQSVRIDPGTDLWMRGGRSGRVEKIGHKWVHVKLDMISKTVRILPSLLAGDQ